MNPKINISQVVEDAFRYWKSTLKYSVIFTIIYYISYALFLNLAITYSGMEPYFLDLQRVMLKNPDALNNKILALTQTQEFITFSMLNILAQSVLYPLNIGWFSIFSKIDAQEDFGINDLFSGYIGQRFFIYMGYYFLWAMIFTYFQSFILPAIIWVVLTLLVAPILFSQKEQLGTALITSFKLSFKYLALVLVGTAIGFLMRYGGIALFLVGYLFTFPFWNAIIYSIYKTIFAKEKNN